MKKYSNTSLVPHRGPTSSQQERSMYGGSLAGDTGVVTSADPKPRLRWTPELHERFVDAVTQLGGADSKYQPDSACFINSGNPEILLQSSLVLLLFLLKPTARPLLAKMILSYFVRLDLCQLTV